MSSNFTTSNTPYDQEIIDIADYVLNYEIKSPLAYETAWHCFIDTIGCGLEALEYEACTKLLGPVVAGLKTLSNMDPTPTWLVTAGTILLMLMIIVNCINSVRLIRMWKHSINGGKQTSIEP